MLARALGFMGNPFIIKRLKDKVAVITGGALGIGKAACIALAKEGAKVAITDNSF